MDTYQWVQSIFWGVMLLLAVLMFARGFRRGRRCKINRIREDITGLRLRYPKTDVTVEKAYDVEVSRSGSAGNNEPAGSETADVKKDCRPLAVLGFEGGVRGKGAQAFAGLVDEVIINAERLSEVVVCIESKGGLVHRYGYLFAQMQRLRSAVPRLTACLDTVAASGGYWMALPASQIIAPESAILGSIGSMAIMPNFHDLLKRLGVEVRMLTAGEQKLPMSPFTAPGGDGEELVKEYLQAAQDAMLEAVKKYRPDAKVEELRKARTWTAQQSMEQELGLVDRLGTSDDYLLEANRKRDLVHFGVAQSRMEAMVSSVMGCAVRELRVQLLRDF